MSGKTGLTIAVPQNLNSLEPIEILDKFAGLQAAFVERYALPHLPNEWKLAEGFYVLLSPIAPDNTFEAYVGLTDYSFTRRLTSHDENKPFWRLAILFKRESSTGFDRMQTRYLEGLLVDALNSSPNVTLHNIKPTGEKNLSELDKPFMDNILLAALRILFLRGYRNAHMAVYTTQLEAAVTNQNTLNHNVNMLESLPQSIPSRPIQDTVNSVPEANITVTPINDEELFKLLKTWRLKVAKENNWSPWIIAKDVQLNNIVASRPTTIEELSLVVTITKNFVTKYGETIINMINQ